MGSSTETHPERTGPLGRWLAEVGVNLLTGGGAGVMAAVSQSFFKVADRQGKVISILPASPGGSGEAPEGYPNPWTEIAIRTHLSRLGESGEEPLSRNHINIMSSDIIIALPGGAGTASETRLAVHYARPIVAFLSSAGEIPNLPAQIPVESTLAGVQAFVAGQLG